MHGPGRALVLALTLAAVLIAASFTHAQTVRQITDAKTGRTSVGDMDDAGSVVFAISSTDPLGTSPQHRFQIFTWDPVTGAATQITNFAEGVMLDWFGPSVSDDGQKIVFTSTGDLTGANSDRGQELFVMNADGTGLIQLTDSSSTMDEVFLYALSGDGSRVAWSSTFDPLGTNPDHDRRLFVVDTDGTGLAQLTLAYASWLSVSDDGQRIAYLAGSSTRGINADGSNDHSIAPGVHAQISGDGSTLSFRDTPYNCNGPGSSIRAVDWDGSNLTLLHQPDVGGGSVICGSVNFPDVTDDGQVVFYAGYDAIYGPARWDIYRVNRDGSGVVEVVTDKDGLGSSYRACDLGRATGSGNRLTFLCEGDEPYGGPNPDHSRELYVVNGDGTNGRQLSDGNEAENRDPEMTPDGTWIAFASDANPLNESPHPSQQIYRMTPDGSNLSRVTDFPEGDPRSPSITDDGSTIVFLADDLSGGYHKNHIFIVQADGTGLVQLTPYHPDNEETGSPMIGGAGNVVVFESRSDLGGLNPNQSPKIFKVQPDGTGLAILAPPDPDDGAWRPRIDPTGTWVVYESLGIYRIGIDGSNNEQLSTTGSWPDVSAGGNVVVFYSTEGGNDELFRYRDGSVKQITFTTLGDNRYPVITDDGQYVYFVSDSPYFEDNRLYPVGVYRADLDTFAIERVGALGCFPVEEPGSITVNHDGSLAVFSADGDCTEQNPDGSTAHVYSSLYKYPSELFLIDRDAPARISVSPGETPTVVSWDHESGPVRYDVIRGDLADLDLPGDATVDLGDVLCIEDESIDADTAGFEDLDTPLPGQTFFYLYRGTHGADAGSGSYGRSSGGETRAPSAGDCPE